MSDNLIHRLIAGEMRTRHRRVWFFASGVMVSAMIAIAAMFLSEQYGGPAILFALLLGMAFNYS